MKTVYLTGFMGSGKTTVGKMLSKYLDVPVMDTDEAIITNTGLSIKSIFALHGEQYFRELEKRTLYSIPTKNIIVTTGGGIVKDLENRNWMRTNGRIVYLHCDFNELWDRLQQDDSRPLLYNQEKDQIHAMYEARKSVYQEYDFMVDTTASPLEEITKIIGDWIKKEKN